MGAHEITRHILFHVWSPHFHIQLPIFTCQLKSLTSENSDIFTSHCLFKITSTLEFSHMNNICSYAIGLFPHEKAFSRCCFFGCFFLNWYAFNREPWLARKLRHCGYVVSLLFGHMDVHKKKKNNWIFTHFCVSLQTGVLFSFFFVVRVTLLCLI